VTDRYDRTELPGGLVVLTEHMPGLRSASIGVWVRAGSVHETRAEMGVSHMLEHMVFKGTTRRTARDLALVLERLGGSLDAYTTREHTCFQARVLDADVDVALDVLADLILQPLLRTEDLDLEREVILEEISTVEDTPDDLVFDLHAAMMWGQHPYGYSILGTRDTVSALSSDDLKRVHAQRYRRGNFVIAAAGNVEHQSFVAQVERVFRDALPGAPQSNGHAPRELSPERQHVDRATSQTHLVWGRSTFGHGDPRRYALVLLSNALGGGMSSRLFQRVREELGLAYAVYAFQSFYADAGMSGVYVGTRPEWADRAEEVVTAEMNKAAESGLTSEELEDTKGQVKGQIVISLESSSARLHRLAGTELYNEPFRTMDEITALVEAVTLDDVAALAADYCVPARQSLLRLGPIH
jgi:predicted Zn-dependent peptidase